MRQGNVTCFHFDRLSCPRWLLQKRKLGNGERNMCLLGEKNNLAQPTKLALLKLEKKTSSPKPDEK